MSFHSPLAVVLAALFVLPPHFLAQQAPGQPPKGATPASGTAAGEAAGLRILVLEGQNVINSLATKTAISPVIQVLDGTDQPVEGADVTFEAPSGGPGGSFGGQPVFTTRTDYRGQATAFFSPNDTPGAFLIKVRASQGGRTVEARIRQANERGPLEAGIAPPPTPWYKDWKWWTLIGVGAGGGAVAGMYFYNKDRTAHITIAPGGGTIGGPR